MTAPALLSLYVISVFIPAEFRVMLGTVALDPYKIVLIISMGVVFATRLVQHKRLFDKYDYLIFCVIVVVIASMTKNHGLDNSIQYSGVFALESFGVFYLTRTVIDRYDRMVRYYRLYAICLLVIFLPALYEFITETRLIHIIAQAITGVPILGEDAYDGSYVRHGMARVYAVFSHPILYGTVGAVAVPLLVYFRDRASAIDRPFYTILVLCLMGTVVISISSAPYLALIIQYALFLLYLVGKQNKRIVTILLGVVLSMYVFVQLGSNRGFLSIFLSFATFNSGTAYTRVIIWTYGIMNIEQNPIFGIGLRNWIRPPWLSGGSVDAYWLMMTMRHGVLYIVFIASWLLLIVRDLLRSVKVLPQYKTLALVWLLSIYSFLVIGITVHLFDKVQSVFFFFCGSIIWIIKLADAERQRQAASHALDNKARG